MLLMLLLLPVGSPVNNTVAGDYHGVIIRTGEMAGMVENNVARLLAERLIESGIVNTRIEKENEASMANPGELLVLLGIPGHHRGINSLFDSYRIPGLTDLSPGPDQRVH